MTRNYQDPTCFLSMQSKIVPMEKFLCCGCRKEERRKPIKFAIQATPTYKVPASGSVVIQLASRGVLFLSPGGETYEGNAKLAHKTKPLGGILA